MIFPTNLVHFTRFAANILRVYGLLKFTKREAYKTWVLSLTGLLTASALAAKANWKLSSVDKKYPFELHPDIRDVFTELEDFQKFVNILSSICKSGTKAFDEFKQGSQRAFSLLKDYRAVMWNSDIKKILGTSPHDYYNIDSLTDVNPLLQRLLRLDSWRRMIIFLSEERIQGERRVICYGTRINGMETW